MHYSYEKIIDDIQKDSFKIFVVPEFKSPKKIKNVILKEMPEHEDYLEQKNKLRLRNLNLKNTNPKNVTNFHSEEPLLTKDQEVHLFRKMHYYKYLCMNIFTKIKSKPSVYLKNKIINLFSNFQEIRHLLHVSNVKLVSHSLKKRIHFYGPNYLGDLFSDAFLNILQAVDHFDYRRNIKFSTFACWCLLNNSLRDHQKNKKFEINNVSNCESKVFEKTDEISSGVFSQVENKESGWQDWFKIKNYFLESNKIREIEIIEKAFGLGGNEKKTIDEIAIDLNLTKERIRQLREKTLTDIKNFVKTGKIKIDGL